MGLFRRKVDGPPPAVQQQSTVVGENAAKTPLLLTAEELPEGIVYPRGLLRLVELELLELEPWWILTGDRLRERNRGMAERYPDRRLVFFARRQDNDDTACWDLDTGKVAIVHDFASPGWEARREFDDLDAWLHAAIVDLIEF
ncbi:hypothetical protein StoSoilA2_20950 [Arthrobacter sp. StoSoilA2]|uniref:hypothetical protein n=1 Tax=Arthrobacter sp. StoSoilA2 TaxID=2830990 RepID=UPI001CC4720C|nr:hypothetical protein [Arthrobacter sp. StoSoilA2]BCW36039.1 hypothetical protein StoSoilA2_20950 [Arthrobacter sp. StoSoilA2]